MEYLKKFGIEAGKGKYHEEAVYGIALLYNLINNEVSAYLNKYDLTPAQFNVLLVIKQQGGREGISQVDISKRLIVTPSNMTRLIDKLEKARLVDRLAHRGDRRVNLIRASEKAVKLLDQAWSGYNEKLEGLVSDLGLDDQRSLSQLINRWLDRLTRE